MNLCEPLCPCVLVGLIFLPRKHTKEYERFLMFIFSPVPNSIGVANKQLIHEATSIRIFVNLGVLVS